MEIDISYKVNELAKKYNIAPFAVANHYLKKQNEWTKRDVNIIVTQNQLSVFDAYKIVDEVLPERICAVLDRFYQQQNYFKENEITNKLIR